MTTNDYDPDVAQSAIQRALGVKLNVSNPSTNYAMQRDSSTLDGYADRESGIHESYRRDLCIHCGGPWHGLPNSMGCNGSYYYERKADNATE